MASELDLDKTELPDFQNYFRILLARRWIVLFVAVLVMTAVGINVYTTTPMYRTSALVIIEKELSDNSSKDTGSIETRSGEYYNTQYILLKSFSLLQEVHAKLVASNVGFTGGIEQLSQSITITPIYNTRLINIVADSDDPKLAARIANTLAETYVDENINNQLHISKEILKALQINTKTPDGKFEYLTLPAVVNNPVILQMEGERSKLESDLAVLSNRYTGKHPAIVSLQATMNTLHTQIEREAQKIVRGLKLDLSGKLRGNNVRIVDPARIPGVPFKPQILRTMGLGALAGLAIGIMCALLIEMLDQTIRSPEDLESRLNMPSLGIIPLSPIDENKPVYEHLISPKLSISSEAFRNMRTMVDLAGVSNKSKTFLLTSSVQGEGKTHIATNLAVAFSQLGESVLLIDGDMRRPRLHKQFRLTSQHGLSEYLAGGRDVSEIKPLIQSTQVPNLQVLVCGPRPPNPSELLNTPRVAALVGWAQAHYDRVIVDCTPIFPIHDTILWGRHVHSCIFTVRHGKTRVPLINSALNSLKDTEIKILGIAINAAVSGGLTYAGYGYYYEQYYHDPEHTTKTSSKA